MFTEADSYRKFVAPKPQSAGLDNEPRFAVANRASTKRGSIVSGRNIPQQKPYLYADLVQQYPDYVRRITADEGDIGRGHMHRFQDVETRTPAGQPDADPFDLCHPAYNAPVLTRRQRAD